jgi:DUF971 family protein
MDKILPEEISANKKTKELTVVWSDNRMSVYPFALMGHACPCEQCKDGHEGMSNTSMPEGFYLPAKDIPTTRLTGIERLGSYGIMIEWEDGHHIGIYSWQYLRALCPCPIYREMMIYGQ